MSVTNHYFGAIERRAAKALVGIATTHRIYDLSGRLLKEPPQSVLANRRLTFV